MKIEKLYTALMILLLVTLWGCNGNEDLSGADSVTDVRLPIELCVSQPEMTTRAIGDPGYDDRLTPPGRIYIWAFADFNGDGAVTCEFRHVNCNQDEDWENKAKDSGSDNNRYECQKNVVFSFTNINLNDINGRVYAVASNHDISEELKGISSEPELMSYAEDISGWESCDLRDLYSNPVSDAENGKLRIVGNSKEFSPVVLYHCAAKVDFKWEVDADIQSTTSVECITLNNLPTSIKLFSPTGNASATGSATITTNTGNKWIGRDYVYVPQPADGALFYYVTFGGSAGRGQTNATFMPTSINSTFTGWYRILATVK